MTTAIICGAGYISGKEIMALELGEGLRARGCKVVYVTSKWGNGDFNARLLSLELPFYRMRLGFISATMSLNYVWMTVDQMVRWPKLLYDYGRFLRREQPQRVIHTNWHHALLLWPYLKPERDLFWLHERVSDKPQYVRFFSALSDRVRCFVVVSKAVAESLRLLGLPENKIHVIHNGMSDPSLIAPRVSSTSSEVGIGIVGQVGEWKGHEDLLVAFTAIASCHLSARLHIFGSDKGEFADRLKQRAEALGVAQRVIWHGFISDRSRIYPLIDICVVPSRCEDPFPLVAIEGAFFGLPVVATRKGGLPEIVVNGVTGYVVEGGAPEQLSRRLHDLLASAELRSLMGTAARQRALRHFGRDRLIKDFLTLLIDESSVSRGMTSK